MSAGRENTVKLPMAGRRRSRSSPRLWPLTAIVAALLGGPAPGSAEEPPDAQAEAEAKQVDPEIFDDALEDFYEHAYADAAAGFWGYVRFGSPAAPNYEWAKFFLAESLAALGLWHGAVEYYYDVARSRTQPEILPEALARLEAVSRERPFDELLVYRGLLYDSDFGYLPAELRDWVAYIQGLHDYRNGFIEWGEGRFQQIRPDSRYAAAADYVRAVHSLKKGDDERSVTLLSDITQREEADPETLNAAFMSLARLHHEAGRYEAARMAYDRVKQIDLSFAQADLLLEKAWTAYGVHEYRKAMGLLLALDAPSYEGLFLPGAAVLRGLILERLCHFLRAKQTARAFHRRYGEALEELRARRPLERIRLIRRAATQDGRLGRRTAFLRTLRDERRLIEDHDSTWEDVELDRHLRRLYDLAIREQLRLWRLEFEEASEHVAEELLLMDEQIQLLDYEVGLQIFKRLRAVDARKAKQDVLAIPYDSANVYYELEGEYWNDELHSYEYFITDRCFEEREQP